MVSQATNALDLLFCDAVGWPGTRSPKVKDWIAEHQLAADSWYVANPNLTVAKAWRLERIGKALDEFLDKISEWGRRHLPGPASEYRKEKIAIASKAASSARQHHACAEGGLQAIILRH